MKFKSKRILVILILVIAIIIPTSCKKDPIQYTFNGHVSDNLTFNAVSDVSVRISQIIFSNTVTSANYSEIAHLYTDASGDYAVTFDREKVSDFKIELDKTGYFSQENIINPTDVTSEDDNVFNYVMEPKAWVRFQFTNFGPLPDDELTLILQNFKLNCDGCATDDYLYFYGAVDTVLNYTTTAGTYAKFIYSDNNGGVSTTDSIYAIPFDTVTYSFNY